MYRGIGLCVVLGLALGWCGRVARADGARAVVAEQEPNDNCPGQRVSCGTIINPASIANGFDWDCYVFSTTAGTPITVGTDDPGGAPFTDTIIDLFSQNCTTILASDGDSGPGSYSLIYRYIAPYSGDYILRVRGSYSDQPQPYEAFIFCGDLPTGACCVPSGACEILNRVTCQWQGGLFQGEGSTCGSVQCPEPPINDRCEDAVAIPVPGTGRLTGNSAFAHDDYDPWYPSCTGMPAGGNDVVYRMDLEPGDVVDLSYTQTHADGSVYMVSDCAQPSVSCVAGADRTGFGDVERLVYVAGTAIPGACCYSGSSCRFISQQECGQSGGIFRGNWTTCDPNYCYMLAGACCVGDGECHDSDPWQCAQMGGQYMGDGTMCYWQPCPRPTGACCFVNGSCRLLTGQDCSWQHGYFLGEDTSCDPDPCAGPFGACCYADHTCSIQSPATCAATGGTYQGDLVSCDVATCGEPVGACCFADGRCMVLTREQCEEYRGIWVGPYPCSPNPCPASPPKHVPRDAQTYYLILDARVDDTGGPWILDYAVTRAAGVDGGYAAGSSALIGSAPNPFVGSTRILYRLAQTGPIRLEIFDAGGRAVRRLVDGAGLNSNSIAIEWDGRDQTGGKAPAGVYFVRLTTGRFTASRAIIRLE